MNMKVSFMTKYVQIQYLWQCQFTMNARLRVKKSSRMIGWEAPYEGSYYSIFRTGVKPQAIQFNYLLH